MVRSVRNEEDYNKLLDFLESSTSYRADRILGRLPSEDMFEVRALLLGRLGRHEGALQIYVYQLDDHATAEEYALAPFLSLGTHPTDLLVIDTAQEYTKRSQRCDQRYFTSSSKSTSDRVRIILSSSRPLCHSSRIMPAQSTRSKSSTFFRRLSR